MAELRYDPLTDDWVMIASHRQDRPQLPKGWCPFCPGSGKVPESYDVLAYDNDYPALSTDPPVPDETDNGLFRTAPAYGRCEVILYSSDHERTLAELPDAQAERLALLWRDRFVAMSKDTRLRYCFIFENRGEAVGVTMPHPHGQIYGYPFIPKRLELELAVFARRRENGGGCLICELLAQERADGRRIVFSHEGYTALVPFYSRYPYGLMLLPDRHLPGLAEMDDGELRALGHCVRRVAGAYDSLFGYRMPYMMCLYGPPFACPESGGWHFHIEYYPPMRSATSIKYNASSETGPWAHCNTTRPEDKAAELRAACERFLAEEQGRNHG